jgi:hypothetical protein
MLIERASSVHRRALAHGVSGSQRGSIGCNRQKVHCVTKRACETFRSGSVDLLHSEMNWAITMAKAAFFAFLVLTAGCTDLKSMEEQLTDLKAQVNKLQADCAKSSSNATAANKATAASASAASKAASKALSTAESNTAAIDAVNAKIDQMFKRRPPN